MIEPIVCYCCNSCLKQVGKKANYYIWQCPNCGFMTTYPLPSVEEVKAVYKVGYFHKFLSKNAIKSKENIAVMRLKIIDKLVDQKESILEIGCAAGNFLDIASKQGWFTAGVELNPQMRDIARKYCAEKKVASSLEEVNDKYSVIAMWECLEHVIDLGAEIESIRTLLKSGGIICLSFPNMECKKGIEAKLAWEQVKPPEHLHYWMASNIRAFLEKFGFSDFVFRYHGPKLLLEGRERLGSRSNPKTVFWPLMSVFWRLLRPFYYTDVKKSFSAFVRRNYLGIEIYARFIG